MTNAPGVAEREGMRDRVARTFAQRFGGTPTALVRAPGRVNLIGDHTDYNDGFVLPMAIDRAVWIAMRPRRDGRVRVWSLDFDQELTFEVNAPGRRGDGTPAGWRDYVSGVAWALGARGTPLSGWEGVMGGDLPIGAGLSSSAALELAAARACTLASGAAWKPVEMALDTRRAEREWVGVNCGIMDQLIAATGIAGHAMLIDCRTLAETPVPLPAGVAVVVLDTGTRRELVGSAYNERREQCARAAAALGARALRDVDLAQLEAGAPALEELARRRARHVVSENVRTLAFAAALARGDVRGAGRLMNESHSSLRDDFEVSRPELDAMVSLAQDRPECYGARMTGAGFGGCAVGLVDASAVTEFAGAVSARYTEQTGISPALHACAAADGASIEESIAG